MGVSGHGGGGRRVDSGEYGWYGGFLVTGSDLRWRVEVVKWQDALGWG
jgi:hypothetical protein